MGKLLGRCTQFRWMEALAKKNPYFPLSPTQLGKLVQEDPPSWMQAQIEEELFPYCKEGFSDRDIEKTEAALNKRGSIYRFVIRNGHLIAPLPFSTLRQPRLFKTVFFIRQLLWYVPLPDLSFLFSIEDLYEELPSHLPVPIFGISKSRDNRKLCLFPHVEWLNDWALIRKENNKRNVPWQKRKEKLFWRGSTSGLGYREGMNPRRVAVQMGQRAPDHIEAHFSHRVQINNLDPTSSIPLKPSVSPWHQIEYKYLLALDGNCFPGSLIWQLSSLSLVFKHASPYVEWYYRGLESWIHYVPIASDLNDLLYWKRWAQEHDAECCRMAQNAKEFAERHLTSEGMIHYTTLLLKSYASLYRRS